MGEAASSWSCAKRGTGECVFFFVHPLHRDHGSFWETVPGPSSCVSLRLLLKEFPVLCARAVRTWNLVLYFRVLVSCSHCSGRLGVAFEYENWILREMTFIRGCNAWFFSGYMLCVSTLAMDEFRTFFYDAADSNSDAFLLHSV